MYKRQRNAAVAALGTPPTKAAPANSGPSLKTQRGAIDTAFRGAVATAKSALEASLSTATTSAQRIAARQAFQAAVANAVSDRQSALAALGTPPVK